MLPEIEAYVHELRHLRRAVLESLNDLDTDALNWKPSAGDTNSLYVLATHCIGSEHGWIGEILAQGPKTRDRPAEFQALAKDTAPLRAQYQKIAQESEEVLCALTARDLNDTRLHNAYGTITLRWIILHIIEHYAEHLGHMRLTRQLGESRQEASKV